MSTGRSFSWLSMALAASVVPIVAGCGAAHPAPKAPATLTPVEIGQRVSPSVVAITATLPNGTGTGTGYVVREDGWIATNYHVVEGAERVSVTFSDGGTLDADTVKMGPVYGDVALLHLRTKNLVPVVLGSTKGMKPGERVVAIGNPKGLDHSLSEGLYNGIREKEGHAIQFSAAISPGSSGGPLLNDRGEVIGMATFVINGQNLNFAVPVEDVKKLMEADGAPMPTTELAARAGDRCMSFGTMQCSQNCSDANDRVSCFALSKMYNRSDNAKEAWAAARRACALNLLVGCTQMAIIEWDASPRDAKVASQVADTLVDVCRKGEHFACGLVPSAIKQAGRKMTSALAAEYLELGCRAEVRSACKDLAAMYRSGDGVKKDRKRAATYAQLAAEKPAS
jgi:hypothetical protein